MTFSHQRYLRYLLGFTRVRVRSADGFLNDEQWSNTFHQPFAAIIDNENRDIAERPVPQVRIAVEVLRHLLDGESSDDEAEYRTAALDAVLSHWSVSTEELKKTRRAVVQDRGEDDTQEQVDSIAERLGIPSSRVESLLDATDTNSEESLEELFGIRSTTRDPLMETEIEPKLLLWQEELLPDEADDGNDPSAGRSEESVRDRARKSLSETLQAAIERAEVESLPVLRDILIDAAGRRLTQNSTSTEANPDLVNNLTRRLALDFGNNGQIVTTRVRQAAETVQTVVFGLRTGWISDQQRVSHFSERHPAGDWEIAFESSYRPADFDEDWHWISTYENWRSAFRTVVYPETSLMPSLLVDRSLEHQPSRAFRTLVERLRSIRHLNPRQARELVNGDPRDGIESGYLTMLSEEMELPDELQPAPDAFPITEQLSEEELAERKDRIASHFRTLEDEGVPDLHKWLNNAPRWLSEAYYLVPMMIGLNLQRSGEFLAALAWFRTVYAYHWQRDQRKIFYGLTFDDELSLNVDLNVDTFRRWMNPHELASERRHAYTRFTVQSIVDCFLDFADAEFTRGSSASIARARGNYLTAMELLQMPEMLPPGDDRATGNPELSDGPPPENQAIAALRQHAKLGIEKLRSGRNIAGFERSGWGDRRDTGGPAPFHRTITARPTIYRYRVLIDRAKQLVGIAEKVEASFLSMAERADAESYNLLQARQDLALSEEQVQLQELRVDEASQSIELARMQQAQASLRLNGYQQMLSTGANQYEREMVKQYQRASAAKQNAANASAWSAAIGQAVSLGSTGVSVAQTVSMVNPAAAAAGAAATGLVTALLNRSQNRSQREGIEASTAAQVASVKAGVENRKMEWRRQEGLARSEVKIGEKQIELASHQRQIAVQERNVAMLHNSHAAETFDFLANKFTNAELYEWMSGVLNRVYRYFLQQATSTALIAQDQLAFERQEQVPGFIQHDYWTPPTAAEGSGERDQAQPDRRGLTGSARLLQDIYKLDQFAFQTRERKLELSQTFSLARLFPFEFEQFRQSGRLDFFTPMELFDQGFPGHYLRLIKRVSVSMLALVSPTDGIRATLSNSGVSRVVVGPDVFRTVEVQRSPERISFTSPMNATGLFELGPENELLLPFEGQGVETAWQLELPQPANSFDFRTISDIILTVDYTALNSASYRRQVIAYLDRTREIERSFHFRQEFADEWYDLHNADPDAETIAVRFETRRGDFPPNLNDMRFEHLLLAFVPADTGELPAQITVQSLSFTALSGERINGSPATTIDGIISTRRSNGLEWKSSLDGQSPIGEWTLEITKDDDLQEMLGREEIEDILFILTVTGETPEWPQ